MQPLFLTYGGLRINKSTEVRTVFQVKSRANNRSTGGYFGNCVLPRREREREREGAFQKTSFSAVTESVLDLVECPIQNIFLRITL